MNRNGILITGGAGFVGSALIKSLATSGIKNNIYILDYGIFGYRHLLDFIDKERIILGPLRKTILACDLTNVKTIIHLSGLSNDPMADFDLALNNELNFVDTEIVVQAALKYKVPRFVFASSASVYGNHGLNLAAESEPVAPIHNYAFSKYRAENTILETRKNNSRIFAPIIFRKGTICGVSPRMRFDLVINAMVASALKYGKIFLNGGGEVWRPILYMPDAVGAYSKIIKMSDEEYDLKITNSAKPIFNIFSENFRISELGLRISNILKVPVEMNYSVPNDDRNYALDGYKMKCDLEFCGGTGLSETVDAIKNWIKLGKINIEEDIYHNIRWFKNIYAINEISNGKTISFTD